MPLNFATLTVSQGVTIPEPKRGKTAGDNPTIPLLEQSRDSGNIDLSFPPIPASETRTLANFLRYGATKLSIGVRVYMTATDGQEVALGNHEKGQPDIIYKGTNDAYTGEVTVAFRAQKRRVRKPTKPAETNGESGSTDVTDDTETNSEAVSTDITDDTETTSDISDGESDATDTPDTEGSQTEAETVDTAPATRRGRRR